MPEFTSIKGKWVPKAAVTAPADPIPEAPKEEVKEEIKEEAPKKESRRRRLNPIIAEDE